MGQCYDLCGFRDDLTALLSELQAVSHQETVKNTLREMESKAALGTFRIGILGRTSTGKSTLVNALFGDVILPEKLMPCTPLPVWIGCSDTDRQFKVYDHTMNCKQMSVGDFRREICYPLDYLSSEDRGAFKELSYASIRRRHERLQEYDAVLIDTLGYATIKEDMQISTDVVLQNSDILLFLVSAVGSGQLLDTDIELLRNIIAQDGPVGGGRCIDARNILFVINFCDTQPFFARDAEEALKEQFKNVLKDASGEYDKRLWKEMCGNIVRVSALGGRIERAGYYRHYEEFTAQAAANDYLAAYHKVAREEDIWEELQYRRNFSSQIGLLESRIAEKYKRLSEKSGHLPVNIISRLSEVYRLLQTIADYDRYAYPASKAKVYKLIAKYLSWDMLLSMQDRFVVDEDIRTLYDSSPYQESKSG